jgi:hypothetical protein
MNQSVGIRHTGTDCPFNGNNLFISLVWRHERINKQNMSTVPFVGIKDYTKLEAQPKGAGAWGLQPPTPPPPPGPKLKKIVDTIWNVLRDVPSSRNRPLKAPDD